MVWKEECNKSLERLLYKKIVWKEERNLAALGNEEGEKEKKEKKTCGNQEARNSIAN